MKPEDAADVARWAANAQHVRALMRFARFESGTDEAGNTPWCLDCGSDSNDAHAQRCAIASAWHALGDPRGQADIERAHEKALRQNDSRRVAPLWRAAGEQASAEIERRFRLASESEQAARERRPALFESPAISRARSDGRGMEAVEDDARHEEHVANLRLAELAERDENNRRIDEDRAAGR